jgi:PAS domain S-box-containing protein
VDHVPLHNVDGDVEGVLVLASEVTEQVRHRRQIEELATVLQSERNILQIIMENTRTHLAYLDPDFNFVAVNLTYAQGSGYSREALIGRNHFALFPDAENQVIFEQVRDTGKPVEFHAKPFEFPVRPELGTTYWDWTLVPVKGVDGQTNGLVLSLTDVTGQIRAQTGGDREPGPLSGREPQPGAQDDERRNDPVRQPKQRALACPLDHPGRAEGARRVAAAHCRGARFWRGADCRGAV